MNEITSNLFWGVGDGVFFYSSIWRSEVIGVILKIKDQMALVQSIDERCFEWINAEDLK